MTSRSANGLASLVRGAATGALGGLLLLAGVALTDKLRLGYLPYGGMLEIAAVPTFVVVGAAFGTVIAIIFWILACKAIYPSGVLRALIGSAIPFTVVMVPNLLRTAKNTGMKPPTPTEATINVLLFVVCFGAIPGIAAYAKIKRAKPGVGDAT